MQINLILVKLLMIEANLETLNSPLQNPSVCNTNQISHKIRFLCDENRKTKHG